MSVNQEIHLDVIRSPYTAMSASLMSRQRRLAVESQLGLDQHHTANRHLPCRSHGGRPRTFFSSAISTSAIASSSSDPSQELDAGSCESGCGPIAPDEILRRSDLTVGERDVDAGSSCAKHHTSAMIGTFSSPTHSAGCARCGSAAAEDVVCAVG